MKDDETPNKDYINRVETIISSIKTKNIVCCKQKCIKRLLEENEAQLRLFLEEWHQLDKKQKEAVLRFTIRICSHWSKHTTRGLGRKLIRFEFDDPILGRLCRKAFVSIIDIGEATLSRHTAIVHESSGRFVPSRHENEGKEGHNQIDLLVRHEVINFFIEIASAVGEESSGRHSRRNEEELEDATLDQNNTPLVFLPSMYSLRLLHHLYGEKIEHGNFSSEYHISWRTFSRIYHSEELSWLRIRSPRDDVCDICLLYRRKMANLLKRQGSKEALERLGGISSEFVQHRDLAFATREVYRAECKKAKEGAERIQKALSDNCDKKRLNRLLSQYEAHYSFDFSQNLWLPQLADTPGQFYFLSLRSVNLFGIVDDGGVGSPLQMNMLYDQTTAGKSSSEVVSMLYHFLANLRNPSFASRRVFFHSDNCVGQNKNSTMIQFFLWCIAIGMIDRIEFKFLLKGHTKFSPDGGFGLIKKHYRRENVYTIEQVANEIKKSTRVTERNDAIILEKKDFGDWKSALQKFFIHLKGISSFSAFIFDKKYPLGEVHVSKHGDDKFQSFNLLNPDLEADEILRDNTFIMLHEKLSPLEQPQMQAKKQWDLYEKVRPYVPIEYQDIVCPKPNIGKNK